jgi:hypothetical protein
VLHTKLRERHFQELVQLVGLETEADGLPSNLSQLVDEPFAVDGQLAMFRSGGNECSLTVPHFEQPFADESLVHP